MAARKLTASRELNPDLRTCLYSSAAMLLCLREIGVKSIIQAGSCFWPRLTREQRKKDLSFDVFGYQWNSDPKKIDEALANYVLPEIHVWLYIPESVEIVDITTKEFPHLCSKSINQDWPGDVPPDYFWHDASYSSTTWPDRVIYRPTASAIQFTHMVLYTEATISAQKWS